MDMDLGFCRAWILEWIWIWFQIHPDPLLTADSSDTWLQLRTFFGTSKSLTVPEIPLTAGVVSNISLTLCEF